MRNTLEIPKAISFTTLFHKKFGGKWKYDGRGTWNCDDRKRFIQRVSGCTCDYDCDHPSQMYLYGDGVPVWVA